jgi:hypothetical protein
MAAMGGRGKNIDSIMLVIVESFGLYLEKVCLIS